MKYLLLVEGPDRYDQQVTAHDSKESLNQQLEDMQKTMGGDILEECTVTVCEIISTKKIKTNVFLH